MRSIMIALFISVSSVAGAESGSLFFSGLPIIGMTVSGGVSPDSYRVVEIADERRREALKTVITVDKGTHLWSSFGDKRLIRIDGEFDIVFYVEDGSGYIKVSNSYASGFYGDDFPFDYIEHRQSGFMISTLFGHSE